MGKCNPRHSNGIQKAVDVWKKDVWDFQVSSQTFLELRFSLGIQGKDGRNLNSHTWSGTPRRPSPRHPRPPEVYFGSVTVSMIQHIQHQKRKRTRGQQNLRISAARRLKLKDPLSGFRGRGIQMIRSKTARAPEFGRAGKSSPDPSLPSIWLQKPTKDVPEIAGRCHKCVRKFHTSNAPRCGSGWPQVPLAGHSPSTPMRRLPHASPGRPSWSTAGRARGSGKREGGWGGKGCGWREGLWGGALPKAVGARRYLVKLGPRQLGLPFPDQIVGKHGFFQGPTPEHKLLFSNSSGTPGISQQESWDIPPKSLVSLFFEGHTELFGPHPFNVILLKNHHFRLLISK